MTSALRCVYVLVICSTAFGADDWNYEEGHASGPNNWANGSSGCGGEFQSPVNLDTKTVVYNQTLAFSPFKFYGYDTKLNKKIYLSNTGYTAQLTFDGDDRYIMGSMLRGDYHLLQIHFHWGSENNKGSEHAVDNMYYPLEVHMVHRHEIHNVSQALVSEEGLAVLGFFFRISEEDNPAYNIILDKFDEIMYKGSETEIPSFPVRQLMGENLNDYYRYAGGLTTPPCHESVVWTVFNEPIAISQRQLNKFRMLKMNEEGAPDKYIVNNYRPLQKMNMRTLYTTKPMKGGDGILVSSARLPTAGLSAFIVVLVTISARFL